MIARLQAWGAAVIAAAVAIMAAFGWGRWRGAQREKEKSRERIVVSQQQLAIAERVKANSDTRSEVDTDVLHLPIGALAPVANAVPDSAADRLYDEWSRDRDDDRLRVGPADSGLAAGHADRSDGPANPDP